jgi:hypothetical protein
MKKLVLTLMLLLSINVAYTQSNEVVIDICTNKVDIHGPTGVICSNDRKSKWFTLRPIYRLDGTRLSCNGFAVLKLNIGKPHKQSQLVFTFKDGSKIRLKSKKELHNAITFYFPLTEPQFAFLKTKKIDHVRYINTEYNSSFQYMMKANEVGYFINLFNNYNIQKIECK